jgi:signal transduction protein with GAF and PtsI domain
MEENNPEIFEKYFNALMEISRAITSERYLEDILKLIVMVTAKVTEAEVCSLWLIEETKSGKTIRLKTTQAIEQEYMKDRTLRMDEGVVGYVASQNKPLIVKNVLDEPRFKEKEMAKKLNLVSMVGVPMQVQDGNVIGVINCFTRTPTTSPRRKST